MLRFLGSRGVVSSYFMVLSSFIECERALLAVYCGYLARCRCLATFRLMNGILAFHDEPCSTSHKIL